jgi:hypothetical protein
MQIPKPSLTPESVACELKFAGWFVEMPIHFCDGLCISRSGRAMKTICSHITVAESYAPSKIVLYQQNSSLIASGNRVSEIFQPYAWGAVACFKRPLVQPHESFRLGSGIIENTENTAICQTFSISNTFYSFV